MADAYGLDDVSLLSGPNQNTARQVQQAFTNNMLVRNRNAARYSLPQLANFNEDNALTQAQTAAGEINQNQQLQNVIDAANHTPHGALQNLSAYLPLLGGLQHLIPTLFGTDATTAFAKQGVVGTVKSWFQDPKTGTSYGLDDNGNVVSMYDSSGNMIPGVSSALSRSMTGTTPSPFGTSTQGNSLTSQYTTTPAMTNPYGATNPNAMDQWPLAGGDSGVGSWSAPGNAADFGPTAADLGAGAIGAGAVDAGAAAGDIFGGL